MLPSFPAVKHRFCRAVPPDRHAPSGL